MANLHAAATGLRHAADQIDLYADTPVLTLHNAEVRMRTIVHEALTPMHDAIVQMNARMEQMNARMDQINARMDQIFDGLNDMGLRVGQINQTTTNIDKRLTASNWNLSIRSQNSIVVRDNMTIHPLYSMVTGDIIVGCPTTTAEIDRMTTVRIDAILRQLDIIPTGSLNMKRRQLKQALGVVVHVL
ncbi:hypothetical protein M431DRAFT_276074 [Trichoderma harzianum CBS 226.95]|uniref:Uncharacterized protein n=1 Tax=Trichoderma harzianum CBS 226.95 TaxID=983964 RepID=A0A2T3ZWX4_TRIHA|nr:hypothetical protein M431DRAFT_276074 [Trichoderma harzianum CBS 226.95]PTB49233.1 hypothetical protein M431DRAFT_276074 [Trichoderma harzianum CBS 226.95]